jgi:hypothetical protein
MRILTNPFRDLFRLLFAALYVAATVAVLVSANKGTIIGGKMSKPKSREEIEEKRLEIDTIRHREFEVIPTDLFKRGQLAGAQQALWWVLGMGLEPVRAILSDAEILQMRRSPQFPGLEPVEPLVECDCGMGDASMPELHADDCAINVALLDSHKRT